jgi:hypothetical protein
MERSGQAVSLSAVLGDFIGHSRQLFEITFLKDSYRNTFFH